MSHIEEVLACLDKVKRVKRDKYVACCPVHDDKKPSLSITLTPDDKILMYCFACGAKGIDVCNSLGIRVDLLFPNDSVRHSYHNRPESERNAPYSSHFVPEQAINCILVDIAFVCIIAKELAEGKKPSESDIKKLDGVYDALLGNIRKL